MFNFLDIDYTPHLKWLAELDKLEKKKSNTDEKARKKERKKLFDELKKLSTKTKQEVETLDRLETLFNMDW